jgi:hypothetical protein
MNCAVAFGGGGAFGGAPCRLCGTGLRFLPFPQQHGDGPFRSGEFETQMSCFLLLGTNTLLAFRIDHAACLQ